MESADLDMGEIFSDHDDDDIGAEGPLPDLPEATQEDGDDDQENVEALARLKDLSKGAGKKVVRRPQPKLDPSRLTGERGIPIIPKLFENIKLKGKGHESADLAVIMRHMEHWGHRLFPKMPFDEVIERVEKLGSKKEVQTCVKKMRLGMPVLNDEFVGSDRDEEDEEKMDLGETGQQKTANAEDMWEELLMEEAEIQGSQQARAVSQVSTSTQPGPSTLPSPSTKSGSNEVDTEYLEPPTTPASKALSQTPGAFTPEQLERMEKNKQMAREKRLKKMGIFSPASPSPNIKLSTSHLPGASQSQSASSQSLSTTGSQINEVETSQNCKKTNDSSCHDGDDRSEVIPQGPTQNISVDNPHQPDAQELSADSRLKQDSEETSNDLGSHSQSQGTDSGERSVIDTDSNKENVAMDAESEESIVKVSGGELRNLSLVETPLIGKDSDRDTMSEVVPFQGGNLSSVPSEPVMDDTEDKENVAVAVSKATDVSSNKLPDMTGDNKHNAASALEKLANITNDSKPVDNEFDDDLTEEQLMESLET